MKRVKAFCSSLWSLKALTIFLFSSISVITGLAISIALIVHTQRSSVSFLDNQQLLRQKVLLGDIQSFFSAGNTILDFVSTTFSTSAKLDAVPLHHVANSTERVFHLFLSILEMTTAYANILYFIQVFPDFRCNSMFVVDKQENVVAFGTGEWIIWALIDDEMVDIGLPSRGSPGCVDNVQVANPPVLSACMSINESDARNEWGEVRTYESKTGEMNLGRSLERCFYVDGVYWGKFFFLFNFERIGEYMEKLDTKPHEYVYLMDGEFTFLGSTDDSLLDGITEPLDARLANHSITKATASMISSLPLEGAKNGTYSVDVDARVYIVKVHVLEFDDMEVVVVYAVKRFRYFEEAITGTLIGASITGGMILLTLLVGFSFSTIFLKPFIEVLRNLQNIADLNFLYAIESTWTTLREFQLLQNYLERIKRVFLFVEKFIPMAVVKKTLLIPHDDNDSDASDSTVSTAFASDVNLAEKPALRLTMKKVAILFVDITGFSGIAERFNNSVILVSFLEDFFRITGLAIQRNSGYVDKILGDGIMAIFGAPKKTSKRVALQAINTHFDYIAGIEDIFDKWTQQGIEMNVTTGISSGNALVGIFGSEQRYNYSALGDVVNMASRLESINKDYNTQVLVCNSVYSQIKNEFVCNCVGTVLLRGKSKETGVYSVVAKRGRRDHLEMVLEREIAHYAEREKEEASEKVVVACGKENCKKKNKYRTTVTTTDDVEE